MRRLLAIICTFILTFGAFGADWRQFRGPNGQGISDEKGLPTTWSDKENIVWKLKLPGAGASSPITLGNRLFVTCYSGYGFTKKEPGMQENLRRHVVCVDRASGKIVWSKEFLPVLPEHDYSKNEADYHGYAPSTPITDGERLYVFFGKSGVYCLDLDGKELWHAPVGKNTHNWGSGPSPILYKNLVIVNASVEAGTIIAFDKMTGKETWRGPKFGNSWNTPILVTTPEKTIEMAVSVGGNVLGIDPDTGKELWRAKGHGGYVVPSLVTHDGIIYAIGGGNTSLAIKSGGKGDVSATHVLWHNKKKGPNASSAIYHEGNLYWVADGSGVLHCQDAATGETIETRLKPDTGRVWTSPILADGKLYIVSQFGGVFVVAAQPKFELIAHNTFADDKSRSNASIAVSDGRLYFRNDQYLYCIGKK